MTQAFQTSLARNLLFRLWHALLGAMIVALVLCGSNRSAAADAANPLPQILVTGEGTVRAAPDVARVRGGVSTRAATAKEAADTNSRAMTAVIAKLVEAGIERKDIQTAQFSIQPVYSSEPHSEPKVVAYGVSNQVIATIRNIEKVSDVLDRIIGAGVTNVGSLEFMVSDTTKALDEARRAAIADARRKAELYAQAAGVALGSVVSISEESATTPSPVFRARALSDGAPPIASGEDTLRVSVSVGFALAR